VGRGASGELEGFCSRYKVISLNIYLVVHLLFIFFLVEEKEKKTSFSFAS